MNACMQICILLKVRNYYTRLLSPHLMYPYLPSRYCYL